MTVRIVTDSTSDLPKELIQEFGITVVPAYVVLNGKTYRDGVDISQDELYQKMVDENIPVTTSQPPPVDFANIYKKLLTETDKIISIQVTSKLSGIYNSALQGRDMVNGDDRIEVVDSLSTSMGLGLITLAAARLAKAGEGLPAIIEEIKTSIPNTHLWGLFDTLKYLFLGGRIGKAKALLGGMLHVKPMLTMASGELHPTGLARTRAKGMERLIENAKNYLNIQDVAIVHSTTPDDAQTLKDRISMIFDKSAIHISRLGPALGVHGGPGTLVLALREKISDLRQEDGEGEKTKRIITLPSLPSIHLPKINFATL
jgi:DegV family protein with EDD domain